MTRVAIMGGGSWGTAFAQVLSDAGSDVVMWARDAVIVESINVRHENPIYHPGVLLPRSIKAVKRPAQALKGADLVVLAMPAQTVRPSLEEWGADIPATAIVVSLAKGIEIGTDLRISQIIHRVGSIEPERIGVLSGPNLAGEIILREPAATTVACPDEENAKRLQGLCTSRYFRAFYTTDLIGVEIAGATKNVIALASGIVAGMELGENAQAAIATRGLSEMSKLGTALGGDPITFLGLAGVGDLIATCASPLSRNRTFGVQLGMGRTVDEVISTSRLTCEAVKSCKPITELARAHDVDMPISELVTQVVHNNLPAKELVRRFMSDDADGGAEQSARGFIALARARLAARRSKRDEQ
jgi:glycerol-3-phosphate dehydrogenase (NAD(P)+)